MIHLFGGVKSNNHVSFRIFVIGVYTTVMPEGMLAGASWYLALIQGIVAIVALTAIAYGLSKSKNH